MSTGTVPRGYIKKTIDYVLGAGQSPTESYYFCKYPGTETVNSAKIVRKRNSLAKKRKFALMQILAKRI